MITTRGQVIGCCLAHRRVIYLSIWGYWTHTDGRVCPADLDWQAKLTR